MMARRIRLAQARAGVTMLAAVVLAPVQPVRAADADTTLLNEAREILKALPTDIATSEHPVTPDRVELGRALFFDPRISVDGTVSCARCHQPALYATDGLARSRGASNKLNPRNAPTVLNAGLQFTQHWRGERKSLEDQAQQSLIGPASFGNPDYAAVIRRITSLPGYAEMFQKAFTGEKEPVKPENWGVAIGAYERTLVTPSRFDDYLEGRVEALSALERTGLKKFIETGCVACHNGPGVGGGRFAKFGVVEDYWKETGSQEIDKGRFDVTHDPADLYVFKVPVLRNVAMTPPYFHDGSVNKLSDAVRVMAKVQLAKDLSIDDVDDIVAFLGSLTGKQPAQFVNAPVLSAAGFTDGK
ncbi:MAG: c-type cytochrome [Alphaproteobacteria bacterium]|nr:c-type cytochrome [Alphaproteobacteria bacterium]